MVNPKSCTVVGFCSIMPVLCHTEELLLLAVAFSCVLDPDQVGGWPERHETKQIQQAHSDPKLMNLSDCTLQTQLEMTVAELIRGCFYSLVSVLH